MLHVEGATEISPRSEITKRCRRGLLAPQVYHTHTMRFPSLLSHNSLVAAAVLLLCLVEMARSAVLAIDYGTEWTKAALVKPGIPLQIVLTKDTKRKEQSVVAFKKQERLYGSDAFNLVFPSLPIIFRRWT